MIYFVVPRDQEFCIKNYAERWGRDLAGFLSILHYEDLPGRSSVPSGTYIFSSLDQLTARGTRLVLELQAQLRASPAACRVLNDPRKALLRLELLEELHRQGLNRHRATGAAGDLGGLRFPVFLREAFRHTGAISPVLRIGVELERAMGRALLQGHRLPELLVVEFCETVDAAGWYRKYAAYCVNSEIIPRSLARGRRWMLKHEEAEFSEALFLEERDYVLANPHERELRRIFGLAGIEYGRIDYAVKDNAIETWEINLNPTVGPGHRSVVPESLMPLRQAARDQFSRRFQAALKVLDVEPPTPSIQVAYSGEYRRGTEPLLHPPAGQGSLVRVVRALHRIRPLLDRAAWILSPLVARAARRFR